MSTYADIDRFRFLAHKVMPLVYDESLSYYEFLCKVIQKLNEVIDNENGQNQAITEFGQEMTLWESTTDQKYAEFVERIDDMIDEFEDSVTQRQSDFEGEITGRQEQYEETISGQQDQFEDDMEDRADAFEDDMTGKFQEFFDAYLQTLGVVQVTGSSTTDVMSQNAVTNEDTKLRVLVKNLLNTSTESIQYSQGGLSSSNASSTTSSTRVRSYTYLPSNVLGFKLTSGQSAWVYAFDSSNAYIGRYTNVGFSTSTASDVTNIRFKDLLFTELSSDTTLKYRLVIINDDDSNIVPDDVTLTEYYFYSDTTLNKQNKIADAYTTGVELKKNFDIMKNGLVADNHNITFDQGGLSDNTASSTTNAKRIRTHSVLPENIIGIKLPTGMSAWVYAFDSTNTYIGRYTNVGFSKSTAGSVHNVYFTDVLFGELTGDNTISYKIVVFYDNSDNIIPADAEDIIYYSYTDTTLKIANKPADAVATANEINNVHIELNGANEEVTEIVNEDMTLAEFKVAVDDYLDDYADLCLCNPKGFNQMYGRSTFTDCYNALNETLREDVYIAGLTKKEICDRINKAFAKPIHRFEDARINLDTVCDFSIEFSDRSGEPSLVVSKSGEELWVYGFGYRYKTNDGMNWTRESIVLSQGSSIGHNGISVIDDTIYLITREYSGDNNLLMYTSSLSDGLNFTYQGIVLPMNYDFGDGMEINNWGNSCMCKYNDTYYLFIEGKDRENRNFWDTYLVTCSNPLAPQAGGTIGDWTTTDTEPIISGLDLQPTSQVNVAVGNPDLAKGIDNRPIRVNNKWYLYVHVTAFSYSYIFRLSSNDMIHWENDGKMYDNRIKPTAGENQSSNADHAIIEFKNRTYFFYTHDINTSLDPHLCYMIDDRPIREILKLRP